MTSPRQTVRDSLRPAAGGRARRGRKPPAGIESAARAAVTGLLVYATGVVVGLALLLALGAWFGVSRRAVAAEARLTEADEAGDHRGDLAA